MKSNFVTIIYRFRNTPTFKITFSLVIVIIVMLFISLRKKSELFTGLAFIMALATAVISDTHHFFLAVISITSLAVVYIFFRRSWWRLLNIVLVSVYISFLFWILNNPPVSHRIGQTCNKKVYKSIVMMRDYPYLMTHRRII